MTIRRGAGFTLTELAIALTVIALLMAVILPTTGLLTSGNVIHITGIAKDAVKATSEFRGRYRFMPGDLPIDLSKPATAELPNATCSGNGNGIVERPNLATPAVNEDDCAADQLYRAGLIRNATLTSKYGTVRIIARAQAWGASAASHPGTVRNVVEFYNVPCEVAQRVDADIDDNSFSAGDLRAVYQSAANVWSVVPNNCASPVAADTQVVISQALK